MNVLVSGSSGLVGSALCEALTAEGHRVIRLLRRSSYEPDTVFWDPVASKLDSTELSGIDAVVNLAGENIAGGRWNEELKSRIYNSRVQGTRLLVETLAELDPPPKTLINASAVGFYGDRGDEKVDEESSPGYGFLSEVCRAWEASAKRAEALGIRLVMLRIGVVLSPEGGALQRMLSPFRLGLGGPLGHGEQYVGWITLIDLVRVIQHALAKSTIRGPLNVVAPIPTTQKEWARALGRALGRPAILPVPAVVLRLLLGREMADELLLSSTRVNAAKLLESGFEFRYSEIEEALRALL